MTFHPQVHIAYDGREADVDAAIAPLIRACWGLDIGTALSCQDNDGWVWIEFSSVEDAQAFVEVLDLDEPDHLGALANRVFDLGWSLDPAAELEHQGQRWRWSVRAVPGPTLAVSVRFRPSDIADVQARLDTASWWAEAAGALVAAHPEEFAEASKRALRDRAEGLDPELVHGFQPVPLELPGVLGDQVMDSVLVGDAGGSGPAPASGASAMAGVASSTPGLERQAPAVLVGRKLVERLDLDAGRTGLAAGERAHGAELGCHLPGSSCSDRYLAGETAS